MPLEKATVPDWTTSGGNGTDSVADTPESRILSEVALFRGLPAKQLSKIEARVRRRTFPAGAHVITVEEPGETVYVVLEGSVKVYVTRPDGTEARKPPTHRALHVVNTPLKASRAGALLVRTLS
jgi:cyclic nucleotide-binding protein